jgi:hypothetical protein
VAYRVPVRQENGSTKLKNKVKMLGSLKDYPRETDILHLKTEFMLRINAGRFTPETNMTLSEFVEKVYLPYVEELRASTKKGYREIWNNHISNRVGSIRMREFRTVDASRMLKAIADENDLTKTTLQHIKSVLSARGTRANQVKRLRTTCPKYGAFSMLCRCCRKQSLRQLPLRGFATESYALSNGPTIKAIRSTSADRSGRLSSIDRRREQAPRPFL